MLEDYRRIIGYLQDPEGTKKPMLAAARNEELELMVERMQAKLLEMTVRTCTHSLPCTISSSQRTPWRDGL